MRYVGGRNTSCWRNRHFSVPLFDHLDLLSFVQPSMIIFGHTLSLSLFLSFILSLSPKHTHTHKHTQLYLRTKPLKYYISSFLNWTTHICCCLTLTYLLNDKRYLFSHICHVKPKTNKNWFGKRTNDIYWTYFKEWFTYWICFSIFYMSISCKHWIIVLWVGEEFIYNP